MPPAIDRITRVGQSVSKHCWRCSETKPIDKFSKNRLARDGRQNQCKKCMYWNHRVWAIASKYGLTSEDYEEMLKRQNGVCAICCQHDPSGKLLSVDHNHKTGVVRGLLCTNCNTAIGKLQDSSVIAYQAARYLERSGA